MVYKKLTVAVALVTLLSACGGGGGSGGNTNTDTGTGTNTNTNSGTDSGSNSSSSGSSALKSYDRATLLTAFPGNKADAQLTETNIGPYLDSVLTSELSTITEVVEITSEQTKSRSKTKQSRKSQSVNTTDACSLGGSATVTGVQDDETGVGTITVSYSQCQEDDLTLNGKQTTEYRRWDLDSGVPTDYTISFEDLQMSDRSGLERVTGTLRVDNGLDCDGTNTYNLVQIGSDASANLMYDNLVIKGNCQDKTSSVTKTVSGDLYLGETGRVTIKSDGLTIAQPSSSSGAKDELAPINGSVLFSSTRSSVLLSSWQAKEEVEDKDFKLARSRLSFDHDGDGTVDYQLTLASRYLLDSQMHDFRDSDQDGLFDGWEQVNGSNPQVADADGDTDKDGIANRFACWRGTGKGETSKPIGSTYFYEAELKLASNWKVRGGVASDLPVKISGSIPAYIADFFGKVDLVIDTSAIAAWNLSSKDSSCVLEANNSRLRCAGINTSQLVGNKTTITVGYLSVTPPDNVQESTFQLPVAWENGFPFAPSSRYLDSSSTALVFAPDVISKGYVLDALADNWVLPVVLNGYGGMSQPKSVTMTAKWSDGDNKLKLTNVDAGSDGWHCSNQNNQLSCSISYADIERYGMGYESPQLQLHFAKPVAMGKTAIKWQVKTDYGDIVRSSERRTTIAYGQSSYLLQTLLEVAEQLGDTKMVIPPGIYVGSLKSNPDFPVTITGTPDSEIWLAAPEYNEDSGDETFAGYSLNVAAVDGVTIHGSGQIKVSGAIRNSTIDISTSDEQACSIDAPVLEKNQINVNDGKGSLFCTGQDISQTNNLIRVSDPLWVMLYASGNSMTQISLVNNTFYGPELKLAGSGEHNWLLTNNLFTSLHSLAGGDLFLGGSTVQLDHNLLPAAYQSLGGSNIYTDTPGVDAANGYGLNADSPALDAGDSGADSGLTDLYGHSRIVGKAMDIGAVEKQ